MQLLRNCMLRAYSTLMRIGSGAYSGKQSAPIIKCKKIFFFQVSVAERSVNRRRLLVTTPGDIRSENADMSNDKSCEKHDRQKFKGFCVQ
jgi:hypothetical protein